MSKRREKSMKLCEVCHRPIPAARLEVLPDTRVCVECARAYPPAPIDADKLDISQASPITRNGFAPKD
jgi:hypothetical protein